MFVYDSSYDLETYSEAHLAGCNLVDPDLNGGELNIKIPSMNLIFNLMLNLLQDITS